MLASKYFRRSGSPGPVWRRTGLPVYFTRLPAASRTAPLDCPLRELDHIRYFECLAPWEAAPTVRGPPALEWRCRARRNAFRGWSGFRPRESPRGSATRSPRAYRRSLCRCASVVPTLACGAARANASYSAVMLVRALPRMRPSAASTGCAASYASTVSIVGASGKSSTRRANCFSSAMVMTAPPSSQAQGMASPTVHGASVPTRGAERSRERRG
jgi:hypothetical protein